MVAVTSKRILEFKALGKVRVATVSLPAGWLRIVRSEVKALDNPKCAPSSGNAESPSLVFATLLAELDRSHGLLAFRCRRGFKVRCWGALEFRFRIRMLFGAEGFRSWLRLRSSSFECRCTTSW